MKWLLVAVVLTFLAGCELNRREQSEQAALVASKVVYGMDTRTQTCFAFHQESSNKNRRMLTFVPCTPRVIDAIIRPQR